jgi:hypothetical protein
VAKNTYLLSELDERSRQYLIDVRRTAGQDRAGIFLSAGPAHATWGFPVAGLVILGAVLYLVVPPLNDPTHQAMLLTAGLLMGGWLILAGIRLALASARGHNLGTFIYVDSRQIWSVDYTLVHRWPLDNLRRFHVEGAELLLEYREGVEKVPVPFEVGIQEIAAYLGYWLQARHGANLDQAFIDLHAAKARAAAYNEDISQQPTLSTEAPVPMPIEGASGTTRDWPILLGILVFGIALYLVVHWTVLVWHDYAVFDFVRHQTPAHWRAYLLDARNTRKREEVQKLLRDRYEQKAKQVKEQVLARNEPGFQGSEDAMEQILLALAEAPQPIVTLRIQNNTDPAVFPQQPDPLAPAPFPPINPAQMQSTAQVEITDSLYSAIGQDLIALVQPPDEVSAFVDIRFKFNREDNVLRLEWTMEVRKNADSDPHYKKSWTTDVIAHPNDVFMSDVRRIKNALVGRE